MCGDFYFGEYEVVGEVVVGKGDYGVGDDVLGVVEYGFEVGLVGGYEVVVCWWEVYDDIGYEG